MPTLTRWSVKAAMLWLVAGLLLGVMSAAPAVLGLSGDWSRLGPLFWHFLTVGWATQLIFGVAYWMFPPLSRRNPYRSPRLGWAVFALLNVGLVARLVAEGGPALLGTGVVGWVFLLSAAAQLAAGVGFVVNTWTRVKARPS